ncbi:MAG: hypothetical protein Q9217_004045 [Psora testacea]
MSALHHVTNRHSPPIVRKPTSTAKAARSVPSTRAGISQKTPPKRAKPRKPSKAEEEEVDNFDDGDDMATSFLQYCCRRRDGMPSTANPYASLSRPSGKLHELQPTILDPLGLSLPRYIPALQPTPRHHNKGARIPPKSHDTKSDLDPTEWKPAERESYSDDDHGTEKASFNSKDRKAGRPQMQSRDNSEALLYLSKFHRSAESRPSELHRALGSGRAVPALSHASTATASTSTSEDSLAGTPYSFISHPQVSVPTTSVTTATTGTHSALRDLSLYDKAKMEGIDYGKKTVTPGSRSARGSLKKLLAAGATGEM